MSTENKQSFGAKILSLFRPIDLTKGRAWKVILTFAFPIILSYLFQQIYTISDAAIVGQTLNAGEVAGVNDTTSLVFIFLQFAFGCSAGFCSVTARKVGGGDEAGTRRSLATQIVLCAALTAVLTAASLLLLDPMLAWINVTPAHAEVYAAAHTYCAIIFAGIGAQMFYNFICSFLRSMGDSFTPLLFLVFSTVLNVGLDLLFIMVFHWGVAGAAIATVAAQLVSTAACFVYTFVKYKQLRLHRADFRLGRGDVLSHLGQGVPLGLQFSVLAVGIIVMQSVVVRFDIMDGLMLAGQNAQNGFGAANKLNNLMMTPLSALGVAMTSYAAQNFGAGDFERVRRGTNAALVIMAVMAAALAGAGLLMTINGAYLYVFLSPDKITSETVRFGNTLLYTDFSMYFFLGFIFIVRNCVQGIGRSGYVLATGAAELVARIAVCLTLPSLVGGAPVDAAAGELSFFALCVADPLAWIAADLVLVIPYIKNILKKNYGYTIGRNGISAPSAAEISLSAAENPVETVVAAPPAHKRARKHRRKTA